MGNIRLFTVTLTVALALCSVLISCNKTTGGLSGPAPGSGGSEKLTGLSYPHPSDFKIKHGAFYKGNKAQCLSCHSADAPGGNTKVTCAQCHPGFPHPNDWAKREIHSVGYEKNPLSCTACHGVDFKGGTSEVSCYSCHHTNFPHAKTWANPALHGKAYLDSEDKKACFSCHTSENKESKAIRCDTCHKAFPHSEDFKGGAGNHKEFAQSYAGKCFACHKTDKKEDLMPTLCAGCHDAQKVEIHLVPVTPAAEKKDAALKKDLKRVPSSQKKKNKL